MTFVSIIVPVYKVQDTIYRCITSVFSQNYSNYEVLFIDDCGGDESISIIDNFIKENNWDKAKIVNHTQNRGLSAARNTGIYASKGDYLYFLDSDDEISSDCISVLVSVLGGKELDLVQGNFKYVPSGWGKTWTMDTYQGKLHFDNHQEIKHSILKRWPFPIMSWNKLIRRDLIIKHKLFFKEGIIHEDIHWSFYISKYITSASISLAPTYLYHQNFSGITLSNNEKSRSSIRKILVDFSKGIDRVCTDSQIKALLDHVYYADFEFLNIAFDIFKNKKTKIPLKLFSYLFSKGIFSEKTIAQLVNAYIKIILLMKIEVNTVVIDSND